MFFPPHQKEYTNLYPSGILTLSLPIRWGRARVGVIIIWNLNVFNFRPFTPTLSEAIDAYLNSISQ
jgi:hypothetical protein